MVPAPEAASAGRSNDNDHYVVPSTPPKSDPLALHRLVSRRDGGALSEVAAAPCTAESVLSLLSADPGALFRTDSHRMTPLHRACESGASVEVVRALLDAAEERDAGEDAARTGWVSFAAGTDRPWALAEWKDLLGRMPLHVACQSGRASPDVVRLLADRAPHALNMVDKASLTPLHHACSRAAAMEPSVRLLVDRCPDALLMRGCGYVRAMAPLHVLCRFGGPTDLVRLLATTRPEVTLWRDGGGQTPLLYAVERWAPLDTVRALVEATADTDEEAAAVLGATRDGYGRTPLYVACESGGPPENAFYLAERNPGALDEADRSGRTPLDGGGAAPESRRLLRRYRDFLRGELDGPGRAELFGECCERGWFWALGSLVRSDPSVVHAVGLENLHMADALAKVGHACGLGVVWEVLRGDPELLAVDRNVRSVACAPG